MISIKRGGSLKYRSLSRTDLSVITGLDIDAEQAEKYLGGLDDIAAQVLRKAVCKVYSIEKNNVSIGFIVLHPDQRDNSCWWLGWWAFATDYQGCGYGAVTMYDILCDLRMVPECSSVKLYVSAENQGAIRLYSRFGFKKHGINRLTGELVMCASIAKKMVWLLISMLAYLSGKPPQRSKQGRLRHIAGPHASRVVSTHSPPLYYA